MTTYAEPERKTPSYVNNDGLETFSKRYDEKMTKTFDFSRKLGSDTISSVVWGASGVSISGESNTTTAITATFLYSGSAKATITLASGDIWEPKYVFLATNGGVSDYCD